MKYLFQNNLILFLSSGFFIYIPPAENLFQKAIRLLLEDLKRKMKHVTVSLFLMVCSKKHFPKLNKNIVFFSSINVAPSKNVFKCQPERTEQKILFVLICTQLCFTSGDG